jgi:YggT family protein
MTSAIVLIIQVLDIYRWIIIAAAVVTWIPSVPRYHPIVQILNRLTEPVLRPIRMILPPEKTGYIDFTPIVALVALQILIRLLAQALVRAPAPVGL